MLEKVRHPGRGRKKNIFAYFLFGLIALTFVFFGLVPGEFGVISGGAAAVVNNEVISLKQYQNRLRMVERQLSQLGNLPAAQRQFYQQLARSRALDDLIQFELIAQETKSEGVIISEKELKQRIIDAPEFKEEGIFNPERYKGILRASGLTPDEYEKILGREVAISRLRDQFVNSSLDSTIESEKDYYAQQTKLKLGYVKLNEKEMAKSLSVSSAEIDEFVQSKKPQIESYYNSHKADYTTAAEAKASHILINAKAGDKAAEEAALTKIKELKKQATPKNFGELAKKHSQDGGSKNKNGSLGYFQKGKMVKPFEDAAFTMEVGTISEPIKTQFGYHLIYLEDRKDEKTDELSKVEKSIAKTLLAEAKAVEAMNEVEKALQEGGDVEAILSKHNLKWQKTEEFNLAEKAVPGIGESEEVFAAAVKLKEKGEISKKVARVASDKFLIRLDSLSTPQAYEKKAEVADSKMGDEIFFNWVQSLKKDAKIERNTKLLSVN